MTWIGLRLGTTGSVGRTPGITQRGIGYGYPDVANAGESFGGSQIFPSNTAWSILVVAAPTSSAAVKCVVSQRTGISPYEQIDLVFNGNASLASTPGALGLFLRNSSAVSYGFHAVSQVDGAVHTWFARCAVSIGNALWRDGVLQTLASNLVPGGGTFSQTWQKTRVGNLGDSAGTGYACTDPILMVVAWPRVLPLWLEAYLSSTPSAVFTTSPIPISSAAAALYPTLTAAGMTGITSTGGRPQVTYTF